MQVVGALHTHLHDSHILPLTMHCFREQSHCLHHPLSCPGLHGVKHLSKFSQQPSSMPYLAGLLWPTALVITMHAEFCSGIDPSHS